MAHYHGGFPFPGASPVSPMPGALVATAPMGAMFMPPVTPVWPSADTSVAIIGDPVKKDKRIEYEDENGTPFYHNPAKPEETTSEKPQDFDKQRNAGEPAPPTKPKEKGPKYKK